MLSQTVSQPREATEGGGEVSLFPGALPLRPRVLASLCLNVFRFLSIVSQPLS